MKFHHYGDIDIRFSLQIYTNLHYHDHHLGQLSKQIVRSICCAVIVLLISFFMICRFCALNRHELRMIFFFVQDNFNRMSDRNNKDTSKTMKQLTRLFTNRVTIQMPQVLNDLFFSFFWDIAELQP